MPGNRLTFAIRVSCQDQAFSTLQRLGDVADMLFRLGVGVPIHGKIVFGAYRAVLGRQVADVAVAGQNRIVGPEVLVDGFRFGGRFDDDDFHGLYDSFC